MIISNNSSALRTSKLSHLPLAVFLFVDGLSVFVWLMDIVGALVNDKAPEGLASYTTEVTYVLDLSIIAPAAFLAAVLVLRRVPLGYLLAPVLLVLNALIGLVVVTQTILQARAGITPDYRPARCLRRRICSDEPGGGAAVASLPPEFCRHKREYHKINQQLKPPINYLCQ